MGLDCTHDAFSGAYSAFNRLRQFVCAAAGGSFPPHWETYSNGEIAYNDEGKAIMKPGLEEGYFYVSEEYPQGEWPGLFEFLAHSDCDGEISPEMCSKVADDLERLLPKMETLSWNSYGHIATQGGYVQVVRKFIAGCRVAARANQSLRFC